MKLRLCLLLCATGCASAPRASLQSVALPGAPTTGVLLDYIATDDARRRVWVPAGNTGSIDVIDRGSEGDRVSRIEGYPTAELERNGTKRTVGPSSITFGAGTVYVGNRADSTVCTIDEATLQRGLCVTLPAMPDGLAYVALTKEVWVTTPRTRSIAVIDASTPGVLSIKDTLHLPGEPEGYAVDDLRGIFYTNLEDQDRTLAIDLHSHEVLKNWLPACGSAGPKGLFLDRARGFLFVACSERVRVLDAGHEGKLLATVETGAGVDSIDYLETRHMLYAAAARAAQLVVAVIEDDGHVSSRRVLPTAAGARNAVVTADGTAYVPHGAGGRVLIVPVR